MTHAIETKDLVRTFKKKKSAVFTAVDKVNLQVAPGEVFGLLGPNGAGKTTLIKILVTLLYPSAGQAFVAGHDVVKDADAVRPLINMVSGGETSGYGILTVRENIWMFSQFYGIPGAVAKKRIDAFLDRFGLTKDAGTKVNRLSTGMRQKMNIIRGFVTDPQILFLDEPTLGLDVHVAREVRKYIREWVAEKAGRTLLLTTHYMAEAEQLCDRVGIIDNGKLVLTGTPAALRKKVGEGGSFILQLTPAVTDTSLVDGIPGVTDAYLKEGPSGESNELRFVLDDDQKLTDIFAAAAARGYHVQSFAKSQPDLEDLFLKVVGRRLHEHE
ncbi:MAG: ABC transporter ATP-binding protein [Candidatus Lernaella stagnicola]|nr:ABC transporter ATP-binding protein [Candidatus Lernaella stagnicola]